MYLNPINSAVYERKKDGANHISMICTFSYSMSVAQSQRKLFQQSVLSAFLWWLSVLWLTPFSTHIFVIQTFNSAYDNLLMATDLTDGITFHSTPQWLFPYLLSGKVLPDVHSCRLRDIFLRLPQMRLQSLQWSELFLHLAGPWHVWLLLLQCHP